MDKKHNFSVLLVEDEKEIRENYQKYLQRHFTDVYVAVDGEDAYVVYKEKAPDIMIVDINLPKLNGLDLLKKIRKRDQRTKLIVLSAYSDVKYLLDATALKLVKYLVKPIVRDELKEALDLAMHEFKSFDIVSKDFLDMKDGYIWDYNTNIMLNSQGEVYLTSKEKCIVGLLLRNANNIMTYDDIIHEVWNDLSEDKLDALKTIIKNIRKKLPKDTIKNVFGLGYKY